jgi:choice-of-anchor A domain-containing protein
MPTTRPRPRLNLETLEARDVPSAVSLGSAANYAVLGLHGAEISQSGSSAVTGNEGVSRGGQLTLSGHAAVAGTVYEAAARETNAPHPVIDSSLLATADADALTAAAQAKALAPTQSFGTITKTTVIHGNGGLNVISIRGDVRASLVLDGGANDVFIINVQGDLKLGKNESLLLSGGVTAGHVLYNFTGRGGSIDIHEGATVNGTILAPSADVQIDGVLNGEVIGGRSVQISSHARVNWVAFAAPQANGPASLAGVVTDLGGTALVNIQVSLLDANGNVVATANTGGDGSYSFTGIAAGTYQLVVSLPPRMFVAAATPGTVNGATDGTSDTGNASIDAIVLGPGNAGAGYNFSLMQPA